ncbi:MAG: isochorismatase family protein [Deltaproteobacteria bacterium]|nr:isochorismatase family protein [Deltaproteobacteria bacterium]
MKEASQFVNVPARPEPLRIDLSRTAVLVVDMQNDFAAPGGMFDRAGIDISLIRTTLAPAQKVLAAARKAAIPIVYLKMEYQPDLSDLGAPDEPNRIKHGRFGVGQPVKTPDGHEGRILVHGTWNTEIVSELAPQAGDLVVSKNRYSGFYETNLDAALRTRIVKYLILTGCTTSVCVESTLRDAMFRGYSCLLLSDCTAEPVGTHDASLLVIEKLFGWVATSGDLLKALSEP